MGTNYYLRGHGNDDDSDYHIGKRSSAGLYCFDCGVTLCKAGESGVHQGHEFHECCPKCGKGANKEPVGLNIRSCCSFAWAMPKVELADNIRAAGDCCPTCNGAWSASHLVIENEYGELFALEQFVGLVDACPIHFECHGERFS